MAKRAPDTTKTRLTAAHEQTMRMLQVLDGRSIPAAESAPALIRLNPLSASRRVVVNRGLTAAWQVWADGHSDESWKLR